MRVLALETSGAVAGAAVVCEDGVLAELSVRGTRHHAEHLHPAIESVCSLSGVALSSIDAVAADVGPGLFTGIRVGVAAAKAIGLAAGCPCLPVTSLRVIAAAATAAGAPADVVPVVDLRRGEVAWALEGEVSSGKPEELFAATRARPRTLFVGDGAVRYRHLIDEEGRFAVATGLTTPPVSFVGLLAASDLAAGGGVQPARMAPVYMREADARINWTTRHDAPGRTP